MKIKYIALITIAYIVITSAGTQADTDEDQISAMDDGDIFNFDVIQNQIFSTIQDVPSVSSTHRGPDPKLLYRQAILDTIQFFNTQDTQINYTRIYFANVWGAEDEGVRRAVAKLNTMKVFLSQKMTILQNRLDGKMSRRERSIIPMDYTTIDMLSKGWEEIKKFIHNKCAEKNLTKIQEDELHFLREWLKYSDQELVLPYNAMKDQMKKVLAAEPTRTYTTQSTPMVILPFSIH